MLSRLFAVRGVLALVFGVVALIWPDITVLALALLFGVLAIFHGIGLLVGAWRAPREEGSLRLLGAGAGLLALAAGIVTLVWPDITVLALAVLAGAWAIVTGVGDLMTAIRLRRVIRGELFLALGGLASIVAGVLILVWPDIGIVAVAIVLGIYALIAGILLLVVAWRLRRLAG